MHALQSEGAEESMIGTMERPDLDSGIEQYLEPASVLAERRAREDALKLAVEYAERALEPMTREQIVAMATSFYDFLTFRPSAANWDQNKGKP